MNYFVVESVEFLPYLVNADSKYQAKKHAKRMAQDVDITITRTREPLWTERLGRDYHDQLIGTPEFLSEYYGEEAV